MKNSKSTIDHPSSRSTSESILHAYNSKLNGSLVDILITSVHRNYGVRVRRSRIYVGDCYFAAVYKNDENRTQCTIMRVSFDGPVKGSPRVNYIILTASTHR